MPDKKPRVLLVDDESAITDNLSPFLERAGFEVGVAEDGEAALTRMGEYPPDLLVLDVLMPRLDGREVLRRMRSAGNWTPVTQAAALSGDQWWLNLPLTNGAKFFRLQR